MTIIKRFTSLEQSRKLAEILPLKSADMCWQQIYDENHMMSDYRVGLIPYRLYSGIGIPCWSLAALLDILPYELCDDDGNSLYLEIDKEEDVYQLEYTDPNGDFESIKTDRYEHFVDACVAMIEKLHELKML